MQPFLSIVVPAYNEEQRISRTLLAIDAYLSSRQFREILRAAGYVRESEGYEIIVADDGSKDATVRIVQGYINLLGNLRLIVNPENHGKGFVVRQGMLEARGKYRLFTDADNATPIEEVEKLLPYLKEAPKWKPHTDQAGLGSYDIAIGSIGLRESDVEQRESLLRVIAGKMGNWLIQLLVLWGIHDTQRGFKLFSAEAAQDVFKRLFLNRWSFDIEALAVARRLGYGIKEVPIRWFHDPQSRVTARAYLNVLLELFKIKWYLLTDKHRARGGRSGLSHPSARAGSSR